MKLASLGNFFADEKGHGLAEYCLITAFIALSALGLYLYVSGGVQDLWGSANSTLVTGSSVGAGNTTTAASAH